MGVSRSLYLLVEQIRDLLTNLSIDVTSLDMNSVVHKSRGWDDKTNTVISNSFIHPL